MTEQTQEKQSVVGITKAVANRKNGSQQVVVLPYDVRAKILPVTSSLLSDVTGKMEKPSPPMWHNKDMDRDEPNYDHPDYHRALEKYTSERGEAVMDAMAMFGLELIDPLPEDGKWLKKLLYMERKGKLDLSEYDLEDEFDLEFVFKRYIAVDGNVMRLISELSGITAEDIAEAEASFRGN